MAEKLPQLSALFDYLRKMPVYFNAAHAESESIKQVISSKVEVANKLAQENNLLKNELNETRRRLSEIMGMKITNDNPGIADLSDANRPTNIAVMYSELYDNQWTDAYENLKSNMSETETIKWLLDILKETHQYCVEKRQQWMDNLRKTLYVNKDETVPDFVMKFIKENRKTKTDSLLETEFQEFGELLSKNTSKAAEIAISNPDYTKECFKVCYLMSIQDPPVVFDTTQGDILDTKKYKQYTQKGERIAFMVWPCLLLCKDGDVLCKGTVQCIPSTKCSVNAKDASLDRSKQSMLEKKQETQRQHEQDAALVSQITGGIEGSHVNQPGNDKEGDVVAIRNESDSPRVAKLPAENPQSGFDVNTDVRQDHQSSASKVSQIGSCNQSVSPGNDKVDAVAGANDATSTIINASDMQNVAKTSKENQNSCNGNGNAMHGGPASISDEPNTKQDIDNEIMSGSDNLLVLSLEKCLHLQDQSHS